MTAENIRNFNRAYNTIADGMAEGKLDESTRKMMSDKLNGMAEAVALLGGRIIPCPCCGKPTLEIDGLTSCSDYPKLQNLYDYMKEVRNREVK